MKGYDVCYGHREDLADERKRNASKGGRSGGRGRGGTGEISEIKTLLKDLTNRGLGEGDAEILPSGVASTVVQIVNARLRTIEVARRIHEQEELEARIEALERASEQTQGQVEDRRRSWGT